VMLAIIQLLVHPQLLPPAKSRSSSFVFSSLDKIVIPHLINPIRIIKGAVIFYSAPMHLRSSSGLVEIRCWRSWHLRCMAGLDDDTYFVPLLPDRLDANIDSHFTASVLLSHISYLLYKTISIFPHHSDWLKELFNNSFSYYFLIYLLNWS